MDVDSGGDPAKAKGTENTLEAVVKYYNSEVGCFKRDLAILTSTSMAWRFNMSISQSWL